jgi:hypothetical protein
MNELYYLSPQAPPWRVVGLLYFYKVCKEITRGNDIYNRRRRFQFVMSCSYHEIR